MSDHTRLEKRSGFHSFLNVCLQAKKNQNIPEAHSEPTQTSKMELLAKIVNVF